MFAVHGLQDDEDVILPFYDEWAGVSALQMAGSGHRSKRMPGGRIRNSLRTELTEPRKLRIEKSGMGVGGKNHIPFGIKDRKAGFAIGMLLNCSCDGILEMAGAVRVVQFGANRR